MTDSAPNLSNNVPVSVVIFRRFLYLIRMRENEFWKMISNHFKIGYDGQKMTLTQESALEVQSMLEEWARVINSRNFKKGTADSYPQTIKIVCLDGTIIDIEVNWETGEITKKILTES